MNREQMRFEAAKAAMHAIVSTDLASLDSLSFAVGEANRLGIGVLDLQVRKSVQHADALLAELDRTAPKPETPQPDADGWVPHKPGDLMPCDGGLRVHVKYRNGDIDHNDDDPARDWDWDDNGSPYDIIAWKPA